MKGKGSNATLATLYPLVTCMYMIVPRVSTLAFTQAFVFEEVRRKDLITSVSHQILYIKSARSGGARINITNTSCL